MNKVCSAAGCKSKEEISGSTQEYLFHHFPKDPILCRQWIEKCGRLDLLSKDEVTLNKCYSLCSLHFPESGFEKEKNQAELDYPIIPSLNLKKSFKTTSVEHDGDQTIFHLMLEKITPDKKPTQFTFKCKKSHATSNSKQIVEEHTGTQKSSTAEEFLLHFASELLATEISLPGANVIQNESSSNLKCEQEIIKQAETVADNPVVTETQEFESEDDLLLRNLCTFRTQNPENDENENTSRKDQLTEKKQLPTQKPNIPSNDWTGWTSHKEQIILPRTLQPQIHSNFSNPVLPARSYKWNLKKPIPSNSNVVVLPPVTVKADSIKFKKLQLPAKQISSTEADNQTIASISVKESTPSHEIFKKNATSSTLESADSVKSQVPVAFTQSVIHYKPVQLSSHSMTMQASGSNVLSEPSTLDCQDDNFQYNDSYMQSSSSSEDLSSMIQKSKDIARAPRSQDPPSLGLSSSKHLPCKEPTLSKSPKIQTSENKKQPPSLDKEAKDKGKPTSRVQKFCRTCATCDSEMIGIFSTLGQQLQLEEKINKVLPITVRAEDRLPVQVCVRCSLWLETAHDLVQACCKAEATLCNLLQLDDKQQEQTDCDMDIGEPMEEGHESAKQAITGDKLVPDNRVANRELDISQKNNPPFLMCYECLEISTSMNHYLKHQHEVHNNILLFCGECCVCFGSEKQFKDHWEELHSIESIQGNDIAVQECTLEPNAEASDTNACDFEQDNQNYETIETAEQCHLEMSHPAANEIIKRSRRMKEKKCEECNLTFPTKTKLVYHGQVFHMKPKKCEKCNEMLPGIAAYKKHKRQHRKEEAINTESNICENENQILKKKLKQCEHCSEKFVKVAELKAHIVKYHREQLRQACPLCNKAFYKKDALAHHMKSHTECRPYLCDICGTSFKRQATLKQHSFSHLPLEQKKRIECSICQKYVRGTLFENHVQHHIDYRPFSCYICDMKCFSKEALESHIELHLRKKGHECEICKSFFTNQRKYFEHKDEHIDDSGSHVCPVCNEMFECFKDTVEHCKTHSRLELQNSQKKAGETSNEITIESILKCNFCNVSFTDVSSYVAHRRTHPEAFSVKCRQCDKRFKTKHGRDEHELHHTGVKKFPCDLCPKSFYLKRHLANHKILHSNVKAFSCQYCSKNFALKKYLDMHVRIHTGETPYNCAKCGLNFRTLANYHSHLRTHNETKRYGCSKCSFRSHQSYNLKIHELTHKELTPRINNKPILKKITCDICGKFFSKKKILLEHRNKHTEMEKQSYKCDTCKQSFNFKFDLATHMLTHESKKQESSTSKNFSPLKIYEEDALAVLNLKFF